MLAGKKYLSDSDKETDRHREGHTHRDGYMSNQHNQADFQFLIFNILSILNIFQSD